MKAKLPAIAVLLMASAVLISCGSWEFAGAAEGDYAASEDYYAEEPSVSMAYGDSQPARGAQAGSPVATRSLPVSSPGDASIPKDEDPVAERKRVFNGYARLEVIDAEQSKRDIRDYVSSIGGYVEQSYQQRITVRVPAQQFEPSFRAILSQGRVIEEQISSYDVTEYFQDLEIRLRLAENTRERLYALLEVTDDVDQRVAILREIRRLSEQIEQIDISLEQLRESLNFSRIDIDLIQALPGDQGGAPPIPFLWIASLAPGQQSTGRFPASASPELGGEFAVFSKGGSEGFYAESARGIRVRIGTVANRPRGDLDFWFRALNYHLSPRFADQQNLELSTQIRGGRFTSFDFEPYVYEVMVEIRGSRIAVYEIFYPDEKEFSDSHRDIHQAILGQGGEL
jgi:hypothetical protein